MRRTTTPFRLKQKTCATATIRRAEVQNTSVANLQRKNPTVIFFCPIICELGVRKQRCLLAVDERGPGGGGIKHKQQSGRPL
jgi:hypothetical protein